VTTGPGDGIAPAGDRGDGRLRASRADREQVVEQLKAAFVEDRLTKDELDTRVGQALASRTYADLAAVTADLPADLPAGPAAAGPTPAGPTAAGPPSTPARTLAKAAARSGVCMLAAFAMLGVVAMAHGEGLAAFLAFSAAVVAVIAASGFLGYGVVDAWQEHRLRGQLPPRPGRDGGGLKGGRPSSTGHDPALPGARPDQTRTDMRTDSARPGRPCPTGRSTWVPRGVRSIPDAV
jgi:hypothetical protein